MNNWNEAGTVHFDSTTDRDHRRRQVSFVVMGIRLSYTLLIPQTILQKLNSADFDEVVHRARSSFFERASKCILQRPLRYNSNEAVEAEVTRQLKTDACEFLYNQFLMRQATAGVDVWAVPQTMEHVGPRPEEDDRYTVDGVMQ